jgi:hypothetical protein
MLPRQTLCNYRWLFVSDHVLLGKNTTFAGDRCQLAFGMSTAQRPIRPILKYTDQWQIFHSDVAITTSRSHGEAKKFKDKQRKRGIISLAASIWKWSPAAVLPQVDTRNFCLVSSTVFESLPLGSTRARRTLPPTGPASSLTHSCKLNPIVCLSSIF